MGEKYEKAVSLNELCKAAKQCKKGVAWKTIPMEYYITRVTSCNRLRKEILAGTYKVHPGQIIQIYKPKRRTATAPWFKDRVWQRSMCNNGVYDDLVRGFITDNIACQKEKGTDMAIRHVVKMLQMLHESAPDKPVYGTHLDVKKYFPSTPHSLIKEMDSKRITEPEFIKYLYEIIDNSKDPRTSEEIAADSFGERGTGLGSQINQLHQVALLDPLDHIIIKICPCYIRYNDDFLLLNHEKEVIKKCRKIIEEYLHSMGLEMTDKTGIFKASNGFYYLRKRFILRDTGKIIIRLHPRALAEERYILRAFKKAIDEGNRSMEDLQRHYQSVIANMEYAGDAPIRAMDKYYTQLFRQKPVYKRKRRYLFGEKRRKEDGNIRNRNRENS